MLSVSTTLLNALGVEGVMSSDEEQVTDLEFNHEWLVDCLIRDRVWILALILTVLKETAPLATVTPP